MALSSSTWYLAGPLIFFHPPILRSLDHEIRLNLQELVSSTLFYFITNILKIKSGWTNHAPVYDVDVAWSALL